MMTKTEGEAASRFRGVIQNSILGKMAESCMADPLIEEDYVGKSVAAQELNVMLLRTGTKTGMSKSKNDIYCIC